MECTRRPLDDFVEKVKIGSGTLLEMFIGISENELAIQKFTDGFIKLQTLILTTFVTVLEELSSLDATNMKDDMSQIIEDFSELKKSLDIGLKALENPNE
jgi:hypothetical protein